MLVCWAPARQPTRAWDQPIFPLSSRRGRRGPGRGGAFRGRGIGLRITDPSPRPSPLLKADLAPQLLRWTPLPPQAKLAG